MGSPSIVGIQAGGDTDESPPPQSENHEGNWTSMCAPLRITQNAPTLASSTSFLISADSTPSADYRKMGNMTGTVRKQTPTLEALQVLYQRMRYEYDFYNFIRDQFHLMKKKIGLKSVSRPTHQPNFLLNLALKTQEPLEECDEQGLDDDMEDTNSWLVQP